jgi:aryl-alcohol dehydrogenase-like predicted oxidoreductase
VADRVIQMALDHGVNYVDVAPRYGEAKLRLKPWMPWIRQKAFLGCKTIERRRASSSPGARTGAPPSWSQASPPGREPRRNTQRIFGAVGP